MSGTRTLFIHHLAMFNMKNHRYQMILRISMPPDAMEHYRRDQETNSDVTYILGNVADDLMTLPELQTGSRISFLADIFKGLPDPHSNPVIHNVRVAVDRVIYFRPFDEQTEYTRNLSYLLYGAGSEAHLAHFQTKAPDFDNVLDLSTSPDWLPTQQLESVVQIDFPSLKFTPPYDVSPLKNSTYQVQFQGLAGLYPLQIEKDLWFDNQVINTPSMPMSNGSEKSEKKCDRL